MRNRSIQQKNENTDIGINQLKKEKSHPMDDSKRNQLFIYYDIQQCKTDIRQHLKSRIFTHFLFVLLLK